MHAILAFFLAFGPLAAHAAPAAGRVVAERECGGCHAVGLQGDSPQPDAPKFRDLRARFDGRALAALLGTRELEGHPRMPRPHVDPDELAALVAYWESLPILERASFNFSP